MVNTATRLHNAAVLAQQRAAALAKANAKIVSDIRSTGIITFKELQDLFPYLKLQDIKIPASMTDKQILEYDRIKKEIPLLRYLCSRTCNGGYWFELHYIPATAGSAGSYTPAVPGHYVPSSIPGAPPNWVPAKPAINIPATSANPGIPGHYEIPDSMFNSGALDHANTQFGVIRDITLARIFTDFDEFLKIPQSQKNRIIELTGHQSGASWSFNAWGMATQITIGVAITAGVLTSIPAPPVSASPITAPVSSFPTAAQISNVPLSLQGALSGGLSVSGELAPEAYATIQAGAVIVPANLAAAIPETLVISADLAPYAAQMALEQGSQIPLNLASQVPGGVSIPTASLPTNPTDYLKQLQAYADKAKNALALAKQTGLVKKPEAPVTPAPQSTPVPAPTGINPIGILAILGAGALAFLL